MTAKKRDHSLHLIVALSGTNDGPRHSGSSIVLADALEDSTYSFALDELLVGWSDPERKGTKGSGPVSRGEFCQALYLKLQPRTAEMPSP